MKQHKEDQNAGKKGCSTVNEKGSNSTKESVEEKEDERKEEQDVVFVQDVGFTIKITAPGVEPFDIQVFRRLLSGMLNRYKQRPLLFLKISGL